MGAVAIAGIYSMLGLMPAIGIAKAIPYEMIGDWNLSAVPMFLLMGYIASGAGLTSGLFAAARVFLNRVPGGLASASVASSALFASASGSSVATAAAFSRSRSKCQLSSAETSVLHVFAVEVYFLPKR